MNPLHTIPNPRTPYSEIVQRLRSLRQGSLIRLGSVSNYPLFAWRHSPQKPEARVVLSAGIHGDEPTGTESMLLLLEKYPYWLRPFELLIFPCLNPWGYERNLRFNQKGKDLNRLWRNGEPSEVAFAKRMLRREYFDLTICIHEDYDATGFYIYELSRRKIWFGPDIVHAVSRILPIEHRNRIEGRQAHQGVIARPLESISRRKYWPEAICHFVRHTNHSLTTETPTHFPIEKRIRAHQEAIRVALRLLPKNRA